MGFSLNAVSTLPRINTVLLTVRILFCSFSFHFLLTRQSSNIKKLNIGTYCISAPASKNTNQSNFIYCTLCFPDKTTTREVVYGSVMNVLSPNSENVLMQSQLLCTLFLCRSFIFTLYPLSRDLDK